MIVVKILTIPYKGNCSIIIILPLFVKRGEILFLDDFLSSLQVKSEGCAEQQKIGEAEFHVLMTGMFRQWIWNARLYGSERQIMNDLTKLKTRND